MAENKLHIPITFTYPFAFLLLTYLCYQAHELFHHLVGGALCGGFGTMTFSAFEPKPACVSDAAVTLSGPFLSFAIAWLGAYWLSKNKHMLFSYTLVFACYAHLRFPLPLMQSGDEWLVARDSLEQPNPFVLAGILFLLALPPLVYAYRSIANPWRVLVFAASWLMPFGILFLMPNLDAWLLGTEPNRVQMALLGIPITIWIVNLSAVLFFLFLGYRIFNQPIQFNLKEIYQ